MSVLWFQLAKKMAWEKCDLTPPDKAVPDRPWRDTMKAWMASLDMQGKRLHVVLYPEKKELLSGQKPALPRMIAQLHEVGITHILDVGSDPAWQPTYYRDDIHQTPEGNQVLARIIAQWLQAQAR